MATIEEAFDAVSETFQISSLNAHQKSGIRAIIQEKKDVFVNLPTGFGKSLLYQALPLVFDLTSKEPGHYRHSCLAIDKPYGGPSVSFKGARAKSS